MADERAMISMYRNHPEVHQMLKKGEWSHDLCGCFDNLGMCIVAYFVPCVSFGQTAEQLGKSCCLYGGCLWYIPFVHCHLMSVQRGEIRSIRGIDGTYCNDCCVSTFCKLCTLVQEQQEVEDIKNDMIAQIASARGHLIVTQGTTTGYSPQDTYVVQGPVPSYVDQKVARA